MKILLMEDDKILQKMYQDKFSSTDYELLMASDGEEGMAKAKSEKPDFILLDLMMPKLSGIQVLKELQTDPEMRHIPVAILSVIPRDDSMLDGNEGLMENIVAYYRKDENNPSDIIEKVKEYLGKKGETALNG